VSDDEENKLRDDVVEMEAETDPIKKEDSRRELDELNSITSEL
jgi:hypothetical protein